MNIDNIEIPDRPLTEAQLVMADGEDEDGQPIMPHHYTEKDEHGFKRWGIDVEKDEALEDAVEEWNQPLTREKIEKIIESAQESVDSDEKWLGREMDDDFKMRADGPGNHSSSKHSMCLRKRYYSRLGLDETEPNIIKRQATFAIGKALEHVMREAFIRAGYHVDHEVYFKHKHPAHKYARGGYVDLIIEDDAGNIVPVELKSTASGSYYTSQYGRGKGSIYPGLEECPRKGNVMQMYDYLVAQETGTFNPPYGSEPETVDLSIMDPEEHYGYVAYLVKEAKPNDNSISRGGVHNYFAIHKVPFNHGLYNEAVYYDLALEWYLENNVEPPRHPGAKLQLYSRGSKDGMIPPGGINRDASKFPCVWAGGQCDHLSRCWSDMITEGGNEAMKARVPASVTGDNDD